MNLNYDPEEDELPAVQAFTILSAGIDNFFSDGSGFRFNDDGFMEAIRRQSFNLYCRRLVMQTSSLQALMATNIHVRADSQDEGYFCEDWNGYSSVLSVG